MEAVPFVKKEPLYLTMGGSGGSKVNEDPREMKETKNHRQQIICSNAKQDVESKTSRGAKSVQKARETIARKVEESKYVGICKRFPQRDTKRRANSVQDTNSNTESEENIPNGFNPLQTKTEVIGVSLITQCVVSNGKMEEGEVNCANASEAGGGAGGMVGNAGGWREVTQEDGGGKTDAGNEEEKEEKWEVEEENVERKEKMQKELTEADRTGKTDGCNERETGKPAGHSPHQNKGLAGGSGGREEGGKQNIYNGRDNSGIGQESSTLEPFLAQFETLEREVQVRHDCTIVIF